MYYTIQSRLITYSGLLLVSADWGLWCLKIVIKKKLTHVNKNVTELKLSGRVVNRLVLRTGLLHLTLSPNPLRRFRTLSGGNPLERKVRGAIHPSPKSRSGQNARLPTVSEQMSLAFNRRLPQRSQHGSTNNMCTIWEQSLRQTRNEPLWLSSFLLPNSIWIT